MEQFALRIANATGGNLQLAIIPAYFDTLSVTSAGEVGAATIAYTAKAEIVTAGFANVDYALDDGTIASNLTATALESQFTIRAFLRWIRYNAPVCKRITISCANTDAFEKTISVTRVSPLGNGRTKRINLTTYFTTQQYNDDKVVVDNINLELSDETLMIMQVDDSRTVDMTFHF